MKYNFCYKYYELKTNSIDIIIELNYDNTLGSGLYGAHSNTYFKDAEGDLGLAAGVGETEADSIKMCLDEITEASKSNNEYNLNKLKEPVNVASSDLKEINLPYRVTFMLGKNRYSTVYFKKDENNLIVLTNKIKFVAPIIDDVIHTLENNIKKIKHSKANNFTKEFLEQNDFYPVFDFLLM